MFMLTIILVILFIGLVLVILEVFFIPGATFVGLLGVIFTVVGIVITYRVLGSQTGTIVLVSTGVVKLAILYYSFHIKAWKKFSLNSSMKSRVNEGMMNGLQIGAMGKAVSTLRPFGKAQFNEGQFEVKTTGPYLDNGTEVRITSIVLNQIIVEPTNLK
jgi:membrane-bound ClpP family serine protease